MTLQSSGAISLANVNTELGRSSTATISLGETAVRNLAGVASGAISLSNLYGKSNVSFSPDGGPNAGAPVVLSDWAAGGDGAAVTITCNQTATWTWSRSGESYAFASVASGGSDTSISFTLNNFGYTIYESSFAVSATAGGITRWWTVNLTNEGFA